MIPAAIRQVAKHRSFKDRATQYRVDYYHSRFGSFESVKKIIGEIMAEMGPKPRSGGEISVIVNRKCCCFSQ